MGKLKMHEKTDVSRDDKRVALQNPTGSNTGTCSCPSIDAWAHRCKRGLAELR